MKTLSQFQMFLEETEAKNPRDQLPLLTAKYQEFNRTLFNNELPILPIEFSPVKGRFAYVKYAIRRTSGSSGRGFLAQYQKQAIEPGSLKLGFSTAYEVPQDHLLGTLVHEMIHIWFCVKDMANVTHDGPFQTKLRELQAKVLFKISVKDSADGYELSSEVRPKEVYAVLFLENQRVSLAAFYNPNKVKMWDLMQHYKKKLGSRYTFEIWRGQTKLYKRFTLKQNIGGTAYVIDAQTEGQIRKELRIAYDSTNDHSGISNQGAIAL